MVVATRGGGAKTQKCIVIVRNGYGVQKERNNEGIETTQRLRRPEGAKKHECIETTQWLWRPERAGETKCRIGATFVATKGAVLVIYPRYRSVIQEGEMFRYV